MTAADRPALTPGSIIDAALRCFARDGVASTSLQDIATELGVTKAAIYHHYATKREIIELALAPAFDTIEQILDITRLHDDPRKQVEGLIVGLADQAIRHRERYRVLLGDLAALKALGPGSRYRTLFDELVRRLGAASTEPGYSLRVNTFLLGLMSPAIDVQASDIDDDVLRRTIASIGRDLLLPEPATP